MKRYPEYKESGVDWIGEIPAHWRCSRFKFHLSENSGGIWGQDDEFGTGTYVLRSTEITIDGHWDLRGLIKREISKEEAERFLLKKGDLVITKSSGSQDHIGKTGLVDEKIESMFVCYSNFVQRICPKSHINSKFLHYFMNCPLAREQYKYQSETTTGLANLNTQSIDELLLSVPPKQEQTQIANFLDRKTQQIDELSRIKERKIELLQEQRTVLINQAVTKGLDPNVEMKPSGVEWIGEIPKHWEVIRNKFIFQQIRDVGYPNLILLSIGIKGIIPKSETGQKDVSSVDKSLYKRVKIGDIAFNVMTVWKGGIGMSDYEGIVSPAYQVCRPTTKLVSKYFHYLFRTDLYKTTFDRASYQVVDQRHNLYYDNFKNISAIFPSFSEQTQIADFLDRKTEQIDELISAEQRKVELLKEYRQSLISEVVTGKIDVRSEV